MTDANENSPTGDTHSGTRRTLAPLPQAGVVAFGTPHHAYLEFDLHDGLTPQQVTDALAKLDGGRTTGQGCNVVIGVRPTLWREMAPDCCPDDIHDFDEPIVGDDGFTMPTTQHDLFAWVQGGAPDTVFDEVFEVVTTLSATARLVEDVAGWIYRQNRDLTGFVDGTENPPLVEAAEVALIGDGPGAGGSVLLLQRWPHDHAWMSLSEDEQSKIMGRVKATDEELDPKPADSHVARTDQDTVGHILRRNTPYGAFNEHGTMFVGFAKDQSILHEMLRRMVGQNGEPRDALTRFSTAVTGSYYFVPSASDLPHSDTVDD